MNPVIPCLLTIAAAAAEPPVFVGSAERPVLSYREARPEGAYEVTVEFGAADVDSVTTLKAETRRLMALNVAVPKGRTETRRFLVDVRRPGYPGGRVAIKSREEGTPSWDDYLSLEFLGVAGRARLVSVRPADASVVRVFLAGDSTVCDQRTEPYVGWGQQLPVFFGPGAVVANHAESGRALRSFKAERRLDKILAQLRAGDFVLIQFGHNDQKEKGPDVGPFTTYASRLRDYVKAVRAKGGRPVLVTAVARRRFDEQGRVFESLGDYPEAVRRVAAELAVPLVDLNESSKRLYQALGAEPSKLALLHYPPRTFPGQTAALADDTHFSAYGAYEMARCVVEGFRTGVPELSALLMAGAAVPFDPERPDAPGSLSIPASPLTSGEKPEGR
ncbi:MAG: rhamnogalacturonan acetylesterase [Opitutales bacterium]